LEQANAELEAFSYSISHDLRAPLRGIDGWSQALLEDYGLSLDTQARGYLDRVRAESQRMGRLIDDILRLSRVSRAELRRQSVDLSDLVVTICDRLRQADPAREVDLVVAPGLVAHCDARLMEIALENLLANAWKFTGRRQAARVEFGQEATDKGMAFFVRDNGAGFDTTYAHRLFAPFQRLHAPEEFSGSGIGLAIVARVIRRHGGSIWPEAVPGEGATFYFIL
jgi:light-regulated signal transduction histidine kinase (bacteriophytochrome)